ncbi:Carbohydrate-selective porin [Paraburkholderia tropica]|uniref:carbohydrate porin n=1 Tax=Paraburkholderia TaxID=1822464 RepID=UPI001CB54E6D|nr:MULTISPECIES: carbohydrate porin [Paraburkholderia]CAG9199516.1 Carbohydrate-selective porin [Paraburkholderia tropica]
MNFNRTDRSFGRRSPALRGLALWAACAAFACGTAQAQSSSPDAPEADLAIKAEPSNFFTGIWSRENLLGDMGGLRPWLGKYGVTFDLTETSEYLANLRGGLKRGGAYDGLTTATLQLDTSKALGIPGGLFNISALQIHGTNLSADNLGTLNTASGIEAQATTRLWEMWYQQSFLDKKLDVKVGQQSIDQEFITSQYAALFVNTMFGWPALPSYDMPSGGPAYPLAGLGVRVRGQIAPSLTGLIGVFSGDPLGNDPNNISGTNFNLHNGTLVIGELQYAINQPSEGELVSADHQGLPGTYKIGFWYNSNSFDDQHYDNTGLSLNNPASTGIAAQHHGNYSIYAVADQMVWRPDPDEPRSIGVFARVMGAPGDRNPVDFSANAGIVMKAPFKGRDNDSVGLAVTYIKVSNALHDLDMDYRNFNTGPYGVRTQETTLEATYQYEVTPWWQIQADAQYTFNAGAGQNPNDPTQPLRNTFVLGVRTNITF